MQPVTTEDEQLDLAAYWHIINARKWSILTLAVLVTVITGFVVYSKTPFYKATATLLIEPQQAKFLSLEDLYGQAAKGSDYYNTQIRLIQSRKIAEQVIEKLHLDKHSEFVAVKSDKPSFDPVASVTHWLSMGEGDEGNHAEPSPELINRGLVSAFLSRLQVQMLPRTQMVTVQFVSDSADMAAKIANAVAETYIEDQLESRVEMTQQATGWLEQRLKVLKANLEGSEKSLQGYMEANNLVNIAGISTLTASELQDLTSRMVGARAKYSELSKRYGAKHPKIIAARTELQAANTELARAKSRIQRLGRKGVKLRELQRQVDSNRQLYDTFLSRLKEASQTVDLKSANARVTDSALPPFAPFKPNKKRILLIAFLLSLMAGIGLAMLLEMLDKTIKRPEDIEGRIGVPLLGMLPLVKSNIKNRTAHAFAMLDPKESAYAEAVRTIRTGLVLSSLDNPHKVILITSSVPGEGKTTVSTNLATAMAKMEKVLLVGADLRRPLMMRALGISGAHLGMTDILAETATLSECVHHIDEPDFDVLPCGQIPPNPLELLSSERFAKLLGVLEQAYDRIIIDSPPLQAVSDSLVLARYAKAVVYVVESDATHETAVKNGIKRLREQKAPLAGVILNKVDVSKASKYGYDYSGYYDHYGYSSEK